MPEIKNADHIQRLWMALEESARIKRLSDVIFYAGRLVDNLVVQPELPVIQSD